MWTDFLVALLVAAVLTPIVAVGVRWRAPGRTNSRVQCLVAFFPALMIVAWGATATVTRGGAETWGLLWLLIGGVATFVGVMLSRPASPAEPSKREERKAHRRGELLDPVYFLYVAAVALGLLAAGVTRFAFADLA